MYIFAFFTQSGSPKTGLSPTVDIHEADGTESVAAGSMTEIGHGFYTYSFTTYTPYKQYGVTIDGTSTLSGPERYKFQVLSYKIDC